MQISSAKGQLDKCKLQLGQMTGGHLFVTHDSSMSTLRGSFSFGHAKICSDYKDHLGWSVNHPVGHFDMI